MLSKDRKITTLLFKEVLESGKNYNFKYFSIKVLKSPTITDNSKFSFVAPKKQFKQAVQRNSIKRKGFNIISDIFSSIKPAFNIIFLLKKNVEKIDYKELKEEIIKSLEKLDLFIKKQ